MRRFALLALVLTACFHHGQPRPIEGPALGRVVIYRNGVAFYERRATAVDGKVSVRVPRERVDDFLKSLTVVDPRTSKPLAVSIPRTERDDGSGRESYLTMTLEASDHQPTDVLLTYITEAPAWKPSYRAVIGNGGKVMLEGWAVVDNMSGEDWKNVRVGVGASSALSFRYDLWSVHHVDRDLLQGHDTFAIAPPTGLSPYAATGGEEELANFGAADLGVSFAGSTSLENQYYVDGVNTTGVTYGTVGTPNPCADSEIKVGCNPDDRRQVPTSTTTGAIQGIVKDKKTGDAMAGVTVVATSPALAQTETAITDDKGYYKIDSLPPGDYLVTFYFADLSIEQSGIHVGVSKVSSVYQTIDQSKAGGETIHIAAKAAPIDPTSTRQGIAIDKSYLENIPVPGRTFEAALGAAAGSQGDSLGTHSDAVKAQQKLELEQLHAVAAKVTASKRDVVIDVHGNAKGDVAVRAAKVRDKLVDEGVPASRIHISPTIAPTEARSLRVLAVAPSAGLETHAPPVAHTSMPDTPVGESHFLADKPMTVKTGSSAMVAMVHHETDGGVVYFYDPISDRGDKRFAFKAVRLVNPTGDTLEPGPITVYGDGRFIGEGITEPVPPHASVVVPFALDRQIVVTRTDHEDDQIAKLETAQRGVITAEIQHRREARFIVTSRLTEPTTVYLRHKLETGWTLAESPSESLHVGDSQLFKVQVGPGETKYVTIAEATPIERTLDLASDETLGMMKVFIDEPQASPKLKEQIQTLLATHHSAADLVDKIQTLREQLADIRAREGELHAQIVTLRAVRAGGELLAALRKKLEEMSERAQKTTIAIVDTQEQLMLTKVKFQNQLAELHLTDTAAVTKR